MSAQRFVLTQHAIDRYLARIGHASTRVEVERAIEDESEGACALREKTLGGQQLFRTDRFVLVCKRDRGRRAWLVVTILSHEQHDRERDEDDGDGGDEESAA